MSRTATLLFMLGLVTGCVSQTGIHEDLTGNLRHWRVEQAPGGRVTAADGALVIEDVGGCTLWFRQELAAPVEIAYEATVIDRGGPFDRVSDLNCFWMASEPGTGGMPQPRSGRFADYDTLQLYYVGYGGNENTTTRFRRYYGDGRKPLLPEFDLGASEVLLKPNHTYRIRVVARDGRAEFWRDGERIFVFNDPEPLTRGWFGFRTVKSHIEIRNFRVTRIEQ